MTGVLPVSGVGARISGSTPDGGHSTPSDFASLSPSGSFDRPTVESDALGPACPVCAQLEGDCGGGGAVCCGGVAGVGGACANVATQVASNIKIGKTGRLICMQLNRLRRLQFQARHPPPIRSQCPQMRRGRGFEEWTDSGHRSRRGLEQSPRAVFRFHVRRRWADIPCGRTLFDLRFEMDCLFHQESCKQRIGGLLGKIEQRSNLTHEI